MIHEVNRQQSGGTLNPDLRHANGTRASVWTFNWVDWLTGHENFQPCPGVVGLGSGYYVDWFEADLASRNPVSTAENATRYGVDSAQTNSICSRYDSHCAPTHLTMRIVSQVGNLAASEMVGLLIS